MIRRDTSPPLAPSSTPAHPSVSSSPPSPSIDDGRDDGRDDGPSDEAARTQGGAPSVAAQPPWLLKWLWWPRPPTMVPQPGGKLTSALMEAVVPSLSKSLPRNLRTAASSSKGPPPRPSVSV